jgi:hypothetical protein
MNKFLKITISCDSNCDDCGYAFEIGDTAWAFDESSHEQFCSCSCASHYKKASIQIGGLK